jgi:hypothetical protein
MGLGIKRWAALAALMCLAAGAVQAQALRVPLGAARAQGEALLAQGQARDLFDNLTADASSTVRLRHRASGLICEFAYGDLANSVVVFQTAPRGDQIACTTGGPAGDRTLYVTRAPGRTLEDAFARDLSDVKRRHPDAQAYALPRDLSDGPILSLLTQSVLPPSRTARFIADHAFTTISSAMVGDWSLAFRYTCPEERRELAATILQPTLWVDTLAQIAKVPSNLIDSKRAAPKRAV